MKHSLSLLLMLLLISSAFAFTAFAEISFSITEQTLPVELSSFTATITAQDYVQINWTTQSETNLTGFYIYRHNSVEQANALCLSPLISPNNNSTTQNYSFTDTELADGLWYYWLESRELDGSSDFYGPVSATISHDDLQGTPDIPLVGGIKAIFPNPFNPQASITTITIELRKASPVQMEIYNLKGELVRSFNASSQDAGSYNVGWDGMSDLHQACGNGIYIVKLSAEGISSQAKLTLMK